MKAKTAILFEENYDNWEENYFLDKKQKVLTKKKKMSTLNILNTLKLRLFFKWEDITE